MWKLLWNRYKFAPLHLLLWVVVWLFYIYFFSYATQDISFVLWFASSLLPVTIATTYIFAYRILPRYLFPKKYKLFALYTVYTLIGSLYAVLVVTFMNCIFQSNFSLQDMPLLTRNFLFVFILVYLVVGLASFIQLLRYNYANATKTAALENRLLDGELKLKEKELFYLKQHIHPHFLFNTLNTIYGAALQKAEETPELILKLSNLLDYTLNQIDKKSIGISEELKYIEAYIGLEQVRFRDSLRVTFKKEIKQEVELPPMLLMAFVENAFKHGGAQEGFLDVKIDAVVREKQLFFQVRNTLSLQLNTPVSHGLGLQLTRKRLDALYPSAYTLEVEEGAGFYEVQLMINFE